MNHLGKTNTSSLIHCSFAQYPNPQQPYYNDNDQIESTPKIDDDLSAAVESKLKIEKEEDSPKTE
jgi:hypothetical protein